MSSLRIDRMRWVTIGLRMVYGPDCVPTEHFKQLNYFRAVEPGFFGHPLYRHYLHVQLDEVIHAYQNLEDPYEPPR